MQHPKTWGFRPYDKNNPVFYATFAFFLVAMDLLCTVYCIAAIRTNVAFFLIFLALIPCCESHSRHLYSLSELPH